jgi:hypothetical protein
MTTTQAEMMMERLLVESATTGTGTRSTQRSRTHKEEDGNDDDESYSEWRLVHGGGLLGSSFQHVTVKEGYHNSDFQRTRPPAEDASLSVIDPEILGQLRTEASTLLNSMIRYHLAVYAACYLGFLLLFLVCWWLGGVSDDFVFVGLIVTQNVWLVGVVVNIATTTTCRVRTNGDTTNCPLTSLVQSYQPLFREEYGVELGYVGFQWSSSSRDGWPTFPSIYLRRSRRVDHHKDNVDNNNDDEKEEGTFSPIYLVPLIPGEIHIDETTYDAASMKVDAETWSLLQSTHQEMIQWHPMMKFLAIPCLLVGFVVLCDWLGRYAPPCRGFLPLMVGAVVFIMGKIGEYGVDARNLKVDEKVTKVVNEVLQRQQQPVAVTFHDSELPGREGKLSRRYQFVHSPLASAPTMNEMV